MFNTRANKKFSLFAMTIILITVGDRRVVPAGRPLGQPQQGCNVLSGRGLCQAWNPRKLKLF